MEQQGNEGIPSGVLLGLPHLDLILSQQRTKLRQTAQEHGGFSVSDFPLRQLSMYIEQILRKE